MLVYDIRNKHKRPIYQSNVRTQKHTDPVWQVYWNPDTSKNYNFYSISSDGRVMNWNLMKNKLEPEELIRLKLTARNNEDESSLIGLASGLCFDFNKFDPNIFILGTEEGILFLLNLNFRQNSQVQQVLFRTVPRDLPRTLARRLQSQMEPLPFQDLHLRQCGLDREDLGLQDPQPHSEFRPGHGSR